MLRERGDHIGFDGGLVQTETRQDAVTVLELEQGQEDVLGADVVVPEPQCLPKRELEDLPRVRVVRDEVGYPIHLGWERADGCGAHVVERGPACDEHLPRDRIGFVQQTEDEVRGALTQLDPLWDELFPAEQARIVQLLVERVDVRMQGVEVRLRPNGLAVLVREAAGSRRAAA